MLGLFLASAQKRKQNFLVLDQLMLSSPVYSCARPQKIKISPKSSWVPNQQKCVVAAVAILALLTKPDMPLVRFK